MAKNGYKILDSDMHVFEPHDLYVKYMDAKWGDRIPRGQPRNTHGQIKFTFADGKPIRPSGTQVLAATAPKQNSGESSPGEAEVAHRYAKPLARRYDNWSQLDAMDEEGLDVAVLFRTFPLHCDDSLEAGYANDLCKAWNNWMADFCKADPKRLRPSALITLHDIDMAVDEARRAIGELGAAGLCLVPEPINGKHIHDRCYDPLWREAERLGAPICFHPAASPNQDQAVHRFKGHSNEAVLINAFRNPIELMFALGSFCAGGVLERFPKLRVAFLEAGSGWLPYMMDRMDEEMEKPYRVQAPLLKQKPSELIRNGQIWTTCEVEEKALPQVLKQFNPQCLMWPSDYPHERLPDMFQRDLPEFFERDDLSDETKKAILHDNPIDFYRLKI